MKDQIDILNKSIYKSPSFATSGSSGLDVRANVSEDLVIKPGTTVAVPTGIFVMIHSPALELQVRPRSGMSLKTKLRIANSPGTIDSDYRGEIKIIFDNIGVKDEVIQPGQRIAQLVPSFLPAVVINEIHKDMFFDDTSRGTGGFGHTGDS
jgi:dUTP pyrophosphatase